MAPPLPFLWRATVIRPCCGVTTLPMSPSWNRIAATRHSCRMSLPGRSATDVGSAGGGASRPVLLLVVPSHVFGQVLARVKPFLRPDTRIAWATKGLEPDSGRLLQEVAREVLGMPFHWRSSRPDLRPRAGRRSADRHLGGLDPRRLCRRSLPPAALRPLVPGLYQSGLHRSAAGRGGEERHRHRCRSL